MDPLPNDEHQDDAIHIDSPVDRSVTLCGQQRHQVWNVAGFTSPRPDAGSGCWTCLQKAENLDAGLAAWANRYG